jgi:SET family sugar efflux transporter-like MFS transporter
MRAAVRQWYPLGLVFLSVGLSVAMYSPFLTLFLTTAVHARPAQVTLYLIVAPLSSVIVSSQLGRLSDRRPIRRPLMIVAAVAGTTAMGLTSVVRDFWVLLALTATATAVATVILPQVFAYARIALYGSTKAAMTMSALRTVFSISWVVGPFLGTVLLSAGGFRLVYAFAALMFVVAGVVVLLWFPEPRAVIAEEDGDAPLPVARPDASRRVLWLTLAAFALMQCAGNLSVQALALFIETDLGGDIHSAGLILGLCAGLEIPLMLWFGVLSTKRPLRSLVLAGPLFSAAYFASVTLSHHIWELLVGQLLNATSIAAIQGLGVTYVQDLLPRHPGRASSLFTNAFPVGAILAGPVLGVAQHLGYRAAYGAAAILALAGFVLLLANAPARVDADEVMAAPDPIDMRG